MISLLAVLLAVVTTPYAPVSYACDGSTAAFTVNFPYLSSSDLTVTSTTAGGAVTTLSLTTDFTTNVSSTQSTATLTLLSPSTKCPVGSTLKIARGTALTQPTSFRQQTVFSPSTHEAALDRIEMQTQERAVDPISSTDLTGNLPAPLLTATGVAAGTYGNPTNIPVITIDSKGRTTSASMTPVSVVGTTATYTAPLSGAVGRPSAGKMADLTSVCDFEAAPCPNGVDDTAAIQAALNLASQRVLVPCGNYKITGLTVSAGTAGTLVGAARECATLTYAGSGTAVTVGTSLADTANFGIEKLTIDVSGGTGASCLSFVRANGGFIRDLLCIGAVSGTDSVKGINLVGTGNFVGSIEVDRVRVNGNFAVGIDNNGAAGVNTCNHIDYRQVSVARTTAKPGTGSIGFRWGVNCGDGAVLIPDIEGYDVGYQIDGRFLTGPVRAENNTTGVVFSATAFSNTIWLAGFTNTAQQSGIGTAGGALNSLFDTIGAQFTLNNGGSDSQVNFTDATDHRVDMQFKAGSAAEQQERIRYLKKDGTLAFQIYKSTINDLIIDDGTTQLLRFPSGNTSFTTSASKNAGTITLSAGTGTATVFSGARCVCSDQTANASCRASVTTTTLTVTGTGTDVISYICL